MVTEIILVIFAIVYYLFSVFLVATLIQDANNDSIWDIIKYLIIIISVSPILTPILFGIVIGIKIGESIKEKHI